LTSSNRQGELQLRRRLKIESQLLKPAKQSDLLEAIAQAMGLGIVPEQPSPADAAESQSPLAIRPLRILLAEDNHVNQRLAVGLLERYGHQIVVAEDGQQAVEFYRDGEYDLILMDVQMPVCDGLEATRQIRQLELGTAAHVPIIAMTAHALVGDRDRCLAAGMDDFIAKPIRIAQVLRVIGDATGTVVGHATMAGDSKARQEHVIVDWKHALDTVGGDHDLLRELAQVFVNEAASMLEDVVSAGNNRSAKDLRRSAHSIKGALNHLGAMHAAKIAYELEQLGEAEDFNDVLTLCDRLRTDVESVTAEFRKFIAKHPAN
jgi:CheY-like chemotaxis protein